MIRGYKKVKVYDMCGEDGFIYESTKDNKKYLLYELEKTQEAQKYSFQVMKKIISTHIVTLYEQFEEAGNLYYVTDYVVDDLLKLQTREPTSVFPLPVALNFFVQIIQALQQLHYQRLVYRNLLPEVLKVSEGRIFLSDFSLSQFCQKKERLFDLVGCQNFLAPQFFLEDGYGFEVDIWAAGVVLFFMLTGDYPFEFKDKTERSTFESLKSLSEKKFSFQQRLKSCKNAGYIQSNKTLEQFFTKIFEHDYAQRITIRQIKKDKLVASYFTKQVDQEFLSVIPEEGSTIDSYLLTKMVGLSQLNISMEIDKQQLICRFIESLSQQIMLDKDNLVPEHLKCRIQFCITKVALVRLKQLVDILYCKGEGLQLLSFEYEQLQRIKNTSCLKRILTSLEIFQKRLLTIYNSAFAQLQEAPDVLFCKELPDDFNDIKIPYREALVEVFQIMKGHLANNKGNNRLIRKTTELMVGITIMNFINRIFQKQDFATTFALYITWNGNNPSLQNLEDWLHNQKIQNLKKFMMQIVKKY